MRQVRLQSLTMMPSTHASPCKKRSSFEEQLRKRLAELPGERDWPIAHEWTVEVDLAKTPEGAFHGSLGAFSHEEETVLRAIGAVADTPLHGSAVLPPVVGRLPVEV